MRHLFSLCLLFLIPVLPSATPHAQLRSPRFFETVSLRHGESVRHSNIPHNIPGIHCSVLASAAPVTLSLRSAELFQYSLPAVLLFLAEYCIIKFPLSCLCVSRDCINSVNTLQKVTIFSNEFTYISHIFINFLR